MIRLHDLLSLPLTFLLAASLCASASGAEFDGPAELPRVYLQTSLANTPAPGRTRLIRSGDNLQTALDQAACGDTLKLQAGTTFTGNFKLPPKPCDDHHWIILRTSAPDESLPPEGTRLTPCWAGVASLPGRPPLNCHSTSNVLARIEFDGKGGSGPLLFLPGANHYRFLGLEITRAANHATVYNLASPEDNATASHLVFDRVWMHGVARDETTRALYISGVTHIAVVDSYFSDFHCTAATGACTDSQAIAGGNGDLPQGFFKIVNNFLEAAGEGIIFGGGQATTTPADVEIRRNHFFKPLIWKQDDAGFIGTRFIVKNHFELKNAERVLFEGNILENTWGGFSQSGFAIVLTPTNQSPNRCPRCRVTDVTLRYNKILRSGSGLQIANVLSDTRDASAAGERYSIHDLVFDDIDPVAYKGFGAFAIVISDQPPLQEVRLDHITAYPPRTLIEIGGDRNQPQASGFSLINSMFWTGPLNIASTGGGKKNCAFEQDPEGMLKSCFSSYRFTNNVVLNATGSWPSGNFFPKNPEAAGIVNLNRGKGGNYRLCRDRGAPLPCSSASPFLHSGTDGKPIGADIEAIEHATAGVE